MIMLYVHSLCSHFRRVGISNLSKHRGGVDRGPYILAVDSAGEGVKLSAKVVSWSFAAEH